MASRSVAMQLRVDVGQPRALQPQLEVGQALVDDVEGVEPALRAHQRPQQQRLAARAGAEVDDHVGAPGRDQVAHQLAAFVLHLDQSFQLQRVARQRGPAGDAQPERGIGRGLGGDARRRERRAHRLARGLQRVDPQVERRRRQPGAGERGALLVAVGGAEALPQPVGDVGGDGGRQLGGEARLEAAHPFGVGLADRGLEVAQAVAALAHGDGQRQLRRVRGAGEQLQRPAPAQPGEHAFGDERAVLLSHGRVAAEELVQQGVGRRGQPREVADRRRQHGDLRGARRHCTATGSSTRIESSSASIVPRLVATTRIFTGT